MADELTTTFASRYTDEISLRKALDVPTLQRYARQATASVTLRSLRGWASVTP